MMYKQSTVLFVCNDNLLRSVVAEYSLRKFLKEKGIEDIGVISRGLRGSAVTNPPFYSELVQCPDIWVDAEPALKELGLDISGHRAIAISKDEFKNASLIVALDRSTLIDSPISLMKQFPGSADKMELLDDITDPYKNKYVSAGDVVRNIHLLIYRQAKRILQQLG